MDKYYRIKIRSRAGDLVEFYDMMRYDDISIEDIKKVGDEVEITGLSAECTIDRFRSFGINNVVCEKKDTAEVFNGESKVLKICFDADWAVRGKKMFDLYKATAGKFIRFGKMEGSPRDDVFMTCVEIRGGEDDLKKIVEKFKKHTIEYEFKPW